MGKLLELVVGGGGGGRLASPVVASPASAASNEYCCGGSGGADVAAAAAALGSGATYCARPLSSDGAAVCSSSGACPSGIGARMSPAFRKRLNIVPAAES